MILSVVMTGDYRIYSTDRHLRVNWGLQ